MNNKLSILHIAYSRHKFLQAVTDVFGSDERLENRYLFIEDPGILRRTKHHASGCQADSSRKQSREVIKAGDYDVAYFHSLPDNAWSLLKLVPRDKTIIWWAWGYDLHESNYRLPPFIPLRYKPITKSWMRNAFGVAFRLKQPVKWLYGRLFIKRYRKEVLRRVDYFQPALAYEWQMMKDKYKDFHAQIFLAPFSHPQISQATHSPAGEGAATPPIPEIQSPTRSLSEGWGVMLGNSGSFGGNLPDTIEVIDKAFKAGDENTLFRRSGGCFIVPLSYGQSQQYMDRVKQRLEASSLHYRVLDKFLPLEDYQIIMSTCPFMVNGTLVQGAVGNITFALTNGAKVFLWRDSILYHHYKEMGMKVFTIDDIDCHSFDEPLPQEDYQHNLDIINKDFYKRKNVYDQVINELIDKHNGLKSG